MSCCIFAFVLIIHVFKIKKMISNSFQGGKAVIKSICSLLYFPLFWTIRGISAYLLPVSGPYYFSRGKLSLECFYGIPPSDERITFRACEDWNGYIFSVYCSLCFLQFFHYLIRWLKITTWLKFDDLSFGFKSRVLLFHYCIRENWLTVLLLLRIICKCTE